MRTLLTLLFGACLFSLQAQNFKFLGLNDTLDFRTEEGLIMHAYIDTFRVSGSDTIFYMNREFAATKQQYQDTCAYDSSYACWMADSVYKTNNTLAFFHPNFGLGINMNASLNQFNVNGYQYQFSHDFRTTCVNIRQNGSEIIRTYSIEALDPLFNPVPQQTDSLIVEISSTRGLLRFPCLSNQHPEIFKENPFYKTLHEFDFKPMTRGELYDFSVGDEFHWSFSTSSSSLREPEKDVILNREDFLPDSVRYTVEVQSERYELIPTGGTPPFRIDTTFHHDTVQITYRELDKPVSNFYNYLNIDNSYWWSFQENLCGTERLTYNEFWPHVYGTSSGPCLTMAFEPGQVSSTLMRGILHEFSLRYWNPGAVTYAIDLVYQKTSDGACGQPHFFSTGENPLKSLAFYPNPVHDRIRFDLTTDNEPFKVSILSITGKQIFSREISINALEMDISSLPAGVYIVRSEKGNGRLIKK